MKESIFLVALSFLWLGSTPGTAGEKEHPAFLAMEHSKALDKGEWILSFRYGLQSTLLYGQPIDPVFGEFHLRGGLLDSNRDGFPYGIDLYAALLVTQTDFQLGTLPMCTFGVRGQLLRGEGWLPTIALQTSATLANKYRSVWSFTATSTWDWLLGGFYGHFLVGGQLGLATTPSPNQTTKGPFFLRDLMLAASAGYWKLEAIVEYGGDFGLGYLALGARFRIWQALYLSGGIRLNLVSNANGGLTELSGFGGLTWSI